MYFKSNPKQEEFTPENPGCLNPDDSTKHLLHYDGEILQQIEGVKHIEIIYRSIMALTHLQKGRWDEALAIGENAYHDALAQGGVVAPLCEMILGMILLERGDAREAGEKLKNAAALLMKMARQIMPENNSQGKVQPINPDGRGGKHPASSKPGNNSGTGREDGSCLFRIQMFGPFRVFYKNKEIHASSWRTVKSRDLLAYLAHRGKPVSTDQILEDLWPDLSTDKASAVFHTTFTTCAGLSSSIQRKRLLFTVPGVINSTQEVS